jgi:hypothetical protein
MFSGVFWLGVLFGIALLYAYHFLVASRKPAAG